MRISPSRIKILTIFAVGCFLLLPGLAAADQYEDPVGTAEFGPGVNDPVTFSLSGQDGLLRAQSGVMSTNATLKSLIISVQNGTQRGKDKASSAVIKVNGQDIFTQKNFNQNVSPSSLTKRIDVGDPDMREVVLWARVNGRKDVRVAVTVTAVYEDQEPPMMQWCLYSLEGMFMGRKQQGAVPPAPIPGTEWRQCP